MNQDVLHIRDGLSKTITVNPSFMTITTDLDREEFVIPLSMANTVEDMFSFAYNRADDFEEALNGNISLNISGAQYPEELGDKAQFIYEAARG